MNVAFRLRGRTLYLRPVASYKVKYATQREDKHDVEVGHIGFLDCGGTVDGLEILKS